MRVKTNMRALNANRQFGMVSVAQGKHTEKLSSGYKINRAADDAAGLAVSEKMRRQVRGLTRAVQNSQDGISFCQVADGALTEVHDMTKRLKELAIQSANGTNTDTDREYLQAEVLQISTEINRVQDSCVFNEMPVFPESGVDPDISPKNSQINNSPYNISVEWNVVDADGNAVPVAESKETGVANANNNSTMGAYVINAAENAVKKLQSLFPNLLSNASSSGVNIGLNLANIDGPGKTLASAALRLSSNSTSTSMSYSMNVDTSDYSVKGFDSMSDSEKANLAATVSHEMTHLVMYDTLTDGMLNGRTTSFPKWFVEGMAQTASGDNGWMSYSLNPSSTDDKIKNYMSQIKSMPYGAGYLATMTLGLAASGSSSATSANIAAGLDSLLAPVADKSKTLDEIIAEKTNYASLADFENKFKSGDADTLSLVKGIINARGTNGGGSLFGNLSASEESVFNPATLSSGSSNYKITPDSTWVTNAYGTGYDFPPVSSGGNGGVSGYDGDGFILQVGTEKGNEIYVQQFNISCEKIFGGAGVDVSTQQLAQNSLSVIDEADSKISSVRAYYGAMQNRLEHTVNNLNNVVENTQAAESQIRDTDMSTEMVAYSNTNILAQAGTAMLSQANQSQQNIMTLLQG